jgi:hypothetical protein
MTSSISSSLLGGVFIVSAVACFIGGVDRGVSSTAFMPADVTSSSIAGDRSSETGRVSVADLAISKDLITLKELPAFEPREAVAPAIGRFSARDLSTIYFDPSPLTNVELPVWNVFRVGAGFHDVSKFRKAPTHNTDKPTAPSVTEKLPVGCDPMVSPVANRALARIPVSCISSNEHVRGDRKLASGIVPIPEAGRFAIV